MNNLPPRELMEQATVTIADQIALFRKTLIAQGIENDLADALTVEYLNSIMSVGKYNSD
jgi:hypothetical protein